MLEQQSSSTHLRHLTGFQQIRLPGESGRQLAQAMLVVAAIRVAAVTIGLGLAFSQHRNLSGAHEFADQAWQYLVIGLAYALALVGTVALRQGRFLTLVAHTQVIFDAALVTAVVAFTNGADSVFTFAYVLVVLEGSVLLLRAGATSAFLASTVLFGALVVVHLTGVLPGLLDPSQPSRVVFGFLVQTLGLGLVALLSSELSHKLLQVDQELAEKDQDLRRLGELQSAILRALPAGLLVVGPDGRIRYGNDAALGLLKLPKSELVHHALELVMPPVSDQLVAQADPVHRTRHECTMKLQNGTRVRLGYSLTPFEGPAGPSTIVVFQDVTEVVKLEAAVRRAERLALVGRFAAGLAHEVRNPLASMCASIDVLRENPNLSKSSARLMDNVTKEAHRLDNLIKEFLAFSRPKDVVVEPISLSKLADDVIELFCRDPSLASVRVERSGAEHLEAMGDPDLVRQVLWNVFRNGAEAMGEEGGTLRVVLVDGDAPFIEVEDDGPGFSPQVLEQALDPFFTTKAKGSGLGLAISQSIMHAHGGDLELENRDQRGARIRLRFAKEAPSLRPDMGSAGTDTLSLLPGVGGYS